MLAVRLAPIKQADNLLSDKSSKMETTTTTREAYKGTRATPAAPIKPLNKSLIDITPFQSNTESRDAFTPKQINHIKPYRLKDNDIMGGSFEGNTGYKDDYKSRGAIKTKSYAPSFEYKHPAEKFSSETTSKADYVSYSEVKKQPYSTINTHDHWYETQNLPTISQSQSSYKSDFPEGRIGERINFKPPISSLKLGKEEVELSTNYKDDFTLKNASKAKSYAPLPVFVKPSAKMESSTEARERFTGTFLPPPKSFRPKYEVEPNRPPLDTLTIYNDSYKKFHFVGESEN